ncbi:MAG: purine-nucleoside phosphorylase [Bacteroides sp.]|nr:purine-nucleoside phosphorylase [Bacteroides sp.]
MEERYLQKIEETAEFIRERVGRMPDTAIILGTGLGDLVNQIDIKRVLDYTDIPNFPVSTVEGHSGRLIFGDLGGKYVMAMQGRFHYYEGYDMKEVTFPVRVMKAIGVDKLFVSNAAGGMNKEFIVGDVMIITDHINLFPENPLRGRNYPELGPRFPAMTEAYSGVLINMADSIASDLGIRLMHGVYVGTAGPTFETPAEYEYFRIIGGDAVGMSTVPEVIVANHAGMSVFGISVITDLGGKDIKEVPTHEEVQKAAIKAQPVMTALITEMMTRI